MPMPEVFANLRLPVIVAPMFLTSGPDLVVETCKAGLVGTFPTQNQRTSEGFDDWAAEVAERTAGAAPFGVNLIVHRTNPRLEADLGVIVKRRVPLVITSLGAVRDVVAAVHAYGGLVFHDVISRRHAEKAAEAGVDGIIAVSAGAGGHAGTINPFALLGEIRQVWDGPLVLGGAISTGAQIAAARMAGADLAYMGTRFMTTREALIGEAQKRMMLEASAAEVVYTRNISGVNANFLRPSILAAGMDPDNLPERGALDVRHEAKAWKDVWSAGHGVGAAGEILPVAVLCDRLAGDYAQAVRAMARDPFAARMA